MIGRFFAVSGARQRGITLIELMVGLAVGMVVAVVLFSSLSVFEAHLDLGQ